MFKNLSLQSLGIGGRQSEQIELTMSYGFKGFDLDIDEFARQVERQGLDQARRFIDSARLRLSSFELLVDCDADEPEFQQMLQRLPAQAALAAQVDCRRCWTSIAPANDLRPYHENFDLWRRRLGQVAEVLGPHDVRLGVGLIAAAHHREHRAFQFIHTFDGLLMLVKTVNADPVGVWLDTWQWHVAGGTLDQVRVLDRRDLIGIDIADSITPHGQDDVDETARRLPGSEEAPGQVDIAGVLATAAEMAFDGPVTPKPHPGQLEGMSRDQMVQASATALDAVWSSAGLDKRGRLVRSG